MYFLPLKDTAGSERYEAMSKIYYRSAKGAIVCYGKGYHATQHALKNEIWQFVSIVCDANCMLW